MAFQSSKVGENGECYKLSFTDEKYLYLLLKYFEKYLYLTTLMKKDLYLYLYLKINKVLVLVLKYISMYLTPTLDTTT